MGCISSKVSPTERAVADEVLVEEASACSALTREREPRVQGTPPGAPCSTPELSEDEDVTYASSSEDESSYHTTHSSLTGRPSNTSHLSSQSPSCHPVYGAASSTDPQAPRHAPLSFFKPSNVVPTNTALRGFATESQVLFFKKLDERIREAPEITT